MNPSTEQRETLHDLFRAVARGRGEQPALLGAGPARTFAELDRASDGVAVGLARRGVEPGDQIGLYYPNVSEFVVAYLGILKAGATVVPINCRARRHHLPGSAEHVQPAVAPGGPGAGPIRSVRFCVAGGSAMPQALTAAFEERFGIPILEGDGPTECSPVTCVNPLAEPRKPGSVGPPIPGVEMRIADPRGTWLADGEVCVRGPNVMRGYWGLEEQTRESFFGGWFHTGNLGYRDADGYFFPVDRIKDLIISNGMNVYPRMIEEVLYRHPDIADAAVVGEPHGLHGEIPIAFVVPKPEARPDLAQVRDWCREHLGRHEIPRRTKLREQLPRNAAGKILKRELRRQGKLERGVDL